MANMFKPLAARMRPQTVDEFIGQSHLLAPGKPLYQAIQRGILHSMILWGPPGVGKTSLAKLLANTQQAHFETISAVLVGVKEIRVIVDQAHRLRQQNNQATVLFVDEIHRFNKSQQDAFLPHIEEGVITVIGATTENPSFKLNNALLSRTRVYVLKTLTKRELLNLLNLTLLDTKRGLGDYQIDFSDDLKTKLIAAADGDARQLLNMLEVLTDFIQTDGKTLTVTAALLADVLQVSLRRFDNQGDAFYDQISALHKSVRGSSPDAALYWLCRLLDGGCDPLYVARRVVRMAIEDIGNADPRALQLAINAQTTYQQLGSPEGELAIAQAVIYLACAAKSNAVYNAYTHAMEDAKQLGSLEVPLHLRNAPTPLMQTLGCSKNYRYAHDEPDGYAAGEHYFPEGMQQKKYYQPVSRGLEIKIADKLARLRQKDKEAVCDQS